MTRSVLAQETVFALRETIARMEGKALPALAAAEAEHVADGNGESPSRLPMAVTALDEALEGGLPLDAITEIRSLGFRHAGAASGFALSLTARLQHAGPETGPVLWISDRMARGEAGLPYAPGLKAFGLDSARFYHALPQRLEDALWLAEAALSSGIFAATLLEVHGNPAPFGLTESRRLSLRAKAAGRPLLLIRHAGEEEASSALFRFLAEPAPALERRLPDGSMLGGSIGHPVFRLTLEKSRTAAPLCLDLEWNPHDRQFFALPHGLVSRGRAVPASQPAAHSGTLLSAPFDRPGAPASMGSVVAFERAS
ncbi:ImuA family protein [Allorhizobium pseudoryzae]|uniref:ImuA family protein n=1 Tax=Allorhizobium pseudoryzae TaxID=379684 RepID=UPI003D005E5A